MGVALGVEHVLEVGLQYLGGLVGGGDRGAGRSCWWEVGWSLQDRRGRGGAWRWALVGVGVLVGVVGVDVGLS